MTGETITTAAELDALPVGSVVLDDDGAPWMKTRASSSPWYPASPFKTACWSSFLMQHAGPGTVLFRPDAPVAPSDDSAVDRAEPADDWIEKALGDELEYRVRTAAALKLGGHPIDEQVRLGRERVAVLAARAALGIEVER